MLPTSNNPTNELGSGIELAVILSKFTSPELAI